MPTNLRDHLDGQTLIGQLDEERMVKNQRDYCAVGKNKERENQVKFLRCHGVSPRKSFRIFFSSRDRTKLQF